MTVQTDLTGNQDLPYNTTQQFEQPSLLQNQQQSGIQGSLVEDSNLRWKILAVYLGQQTFFPLNTNKYSIDSIDEVLGGCDDIQVRIERNLSKQQFQSVLQEYRPNLLYVCGSFIFQNEDTLLNAQISDFVLQDERTQEYSAVTSEEFSEYIEDLEVQCVYLDVHQQQDVYGHQLVQKGVECIISVPYGIPLLALPMLQLSHAFFGFLRHPHCNMYEAVTLASHTQQIHPNTLQLLPQFWGNNVMLQLPNTSTIPFPNIENVDPEQSLVEQIEGWQDIRMLAPRAECRLQVCGFQSIIDPQRLGFVSQALRSILVFETRHLTILEAKALGYSPPQLIKGEGYQYRIQTTSGAECTVVLGGPEEVLSNPQLVEHALRITLTSDAMTVQFRIPPPGLPPPKPLIIPNLAYGTPLIENTACTSVWVVQVLKYLAQNQNYRGFIPLGIAAIGSTTVASFQPGDAIRFCNVVSQLNPDSEQFMDPYYLEGINQQIQQEEQQQQEPEYNEEEVVVAQQPIKKVEHEQPNGTGSGRTVNPKVSEPEQHDPPPVSHIDYGSNRPPLDECSEDDFLEDVARFLEKKRGTQIDREKFPDSILNKTPLDLFGLYKAVCERGGYRMGNSINWKSWIFPKMRNWTETHKMTGIGNDLKKRYVRYLEEYEYSNPQDANPNP